MDHLPGDPAGAGAGARQLLSRVGASVAVTASYGMLTWGTMVTYDPTQISLLAWCLAQTAGLVAMGAVAASLPPSPGTA